MNKPPLGQQNSARQPQAPPCSCCRIPHSAKPQTLPAPLPRTAPLWAIPNPLTNVLTAA